MLREFQSFEANPKEEKLKKKKIVKNIKFKHIIHIQTYD